MIKQEVGVMQKIDHPNIISLFEQMETPDKYYCVLELIDGKLLTIVQRMKIYKDYFNSSVD